MNAATPPARGGSLCADPQADLRADLLRLAHDALLEHLNRGDARHALRGLLSALNRRLSAHCSLQALSEDGHPLWTEGTPEAQAGDWPELPLRRLDHVVGRLRVQTTGAAGELATTLQPLLPTVAALLLRDAEAGAGPADAGQVAMVRAALHGAGTFVWEWNVDNDSLGDIDEGLQQLGYSAEQIGRTQDDWNSLIHPEDLLANHEAYLRHQRGEVDTYEHAYRARHRDGHWRWLQERGRIVERQADGTPLRMLGTQTDITERRAAEQAASDAMQRLEKIAHHAPGLLFQFERAPGGPPRFRYVSDRIVELFGVAPGDAMRDGSLLWAAVHPEDLNATRASIDVSAETLAEWRQEFRVRRRAGATRWLFGSATPQREADGTVVWHGSMQDLTQRRELEDARQSAATAAAANRAKTEFLSRMSHELRTPLNAVLGFTQLMEIDRNDPPSEGQQRRLTLIRDAGEHLLQMIDDLLDVTRIEAGGMALQLQPVALVPLVSECLAMLQGAAERAAITLVAPAAGDTGSQVLADRTRLRQVLLNLLSNAIKYGRPGGHAEVLLSAAVAGKVRMRVRDDGVGIGPADMARLFEPFYRGVNTRGSVDGAGIGLSVTQALVVLMDGRIEVQSEPGVGSVFTVTLPGA